MTQSTISFADALKAFRRGVHQNPEHWRAVVLVSSAAQLEIAWYEARFTLEAASIPIQKCELSKRLLTTKNGATLVFFIVDRGVHGMERLAGMGFTHIIWLFDGGAHNYSLGEALKRSYYVKSGLRTDMVSL